MEYNYSIYMIWKLYTTIVTVTDNETNICLQLVLATVPEKSGHTVEYFVCTAQFKAD